MISALTYEWRRLWSVRSTWVVSGLYLLITGLLGALPIYLVGENFKQSWNGLYSTNANFLCLVMLGIVASQSWGHEYRYGMIRITFSEFPAREKVVVAKTLVLFVYVTLMVVLAWSLLGLIGATAPAGRISKANPGMSLATGSDHVPDLWKVFVFSLAYALFSSSLVMIARNLALGIVLPLLLATTIESLIILLANLAKGRMDWFAHSLPFTNGQAWLAGTSDLRQPGLVFAAWVVGLFLLANIRIAKSDA